MQEFERYAVYYAPQSESDLWHFGTSWLGYNPETTEIKDRPTLTALSADTLADYTSSPARYGFHGTLKPPFSLKEGYTRGDLELALSLLADKQKKVRSGPLFLRKIGKFLCLMPSNSKKGIIELAADCVVELDEFRGAQSEAQLAKRRAAGLTEQQEMYLQEYGYPYVLDEFRFHLTLSNSLPEEALAELSAELGALTDPLCQADFEISEICLFGDPGQGAPFQLLRRFALR